MVYESGFTTRRTYTRPVVSSYTYSYPTISRVYKTSYPIYSSYPYISGTRVISSPITRVIRSPSPVRVTRTTTRIISSPERTSSYSYTLPSSYYSSLSYLPSSYTSSYYVPSSYYLPSYYTSPYIPSSYYYFSPSYVYSPISSRIYSRSLSPVRTITSPSYLTTHLRTIPAGYAARQLSNYLGTAAFDNFRAETDRIRFRAQSLIRDIHTPVIRRARSATPFPVSYEPFTSKLALDAYVSRVTDPFRHVAKEVHDIALNSEPAHRYMGHDLDPWRPSRKFGADSSQKSNDSKDKTSRPEQLLTVNEEMVDEIEMEKKNAAREDEQKRALEKEARLIEEARLVEKARLAEETDARRLAEEKRRIEEAEESERLAAETTRMQEEEERRQREEELNRLVEIEKQAEAERLLKEAARLAEEERIAAEEERAARLKEEAARKHEEEINRLAEIEKQAKEEREAEIARQAAELADFARQEEEISSQELNTRQEIEEATSPTAGLDTSYSNDPLVNEPQSPLDDGSSAPILEFKSNAGESVDIVQSDEEYEEDEESEN